MHSNTPQIGLVGAMVSVHAQIPSLLRALSCRGQLALLFLSGNVRRSFLARVWAINVPSYMANCTSRAVSINLTLLGGAESMHSDTPHCGHVGAQVYVPAQIPSHLRALSCRGQLAFPFLCGK